MFLISKQTMTLSDNPKRCGIRGYAHSYDRQRAIKQLARQGINHFVCYHDTQSRYALMYSIAAWVGNGIYVDR